MSTTGPVKNTTGDETRAPSRTELSVRDALARTDSYDDARSVEALDYLDDIEIMLDGLRINPQDPLAPAFVDNKPDEELTEVTAILRFTFAFFDS